MKDDVLVSIVTPSYNQGAFLEETIISVLSQSYERIEYIVIDGGSTDKSVDIIRHYGDRIAYWVSEPDRGQAHAINKGLSHAAGEIQGWLNSDDTLMPGAVARVVEAMDQTPTVVHGAVHLVDARGKVIMRPKLSKRRREFGLATIVDDGLVNQPGAFWNRAALERTGLLDEDLDYVMDYELWVRMALAGVQFKRLQDPPLATYRLADDTKTVSNMDRMGLETLDVLDQLLSDPDLPGKLEITSTELRRRARRARALALLKVGRGYAVSSGRRVDSLLMLARAVWLWPPCLLLIPESLARRAHLNVAVRLGREVPSW